MKAVVRLMLIFFLLLSVSTSTHAENITTDIYFNRAGTKIVSGIANVATGCMELPKNLAIWNEKDDQIVIGTINGLLWGMFHTVGRTANGAVDFATFWLPTYPIPDPVFIWEDFWKETDYLGWRMAR